MSYRINILLIIQVRINKKNLCITSDRKKIKKIGESMGCL